MFGITVERVITDNGSAYKGNLRRDCLTGLGRDRFGVMPNHHRAHGALG
jgi:hypothetical protein